MGAIVVLPRMKSLSVSKIKDSVENCNLRTGWDYLLKLNKVPRTTNYFALGGTALHKAIEIALKEVKAGKPLMSGAELQRLFLEKTWDATIDEAKKEGQVITDDPEDPAESVRAELALLAPIVREQVLVHLQPAGIEESFEQKVTAHEEPFSVYGVIDYRDLRAFYLDWKTVKEVKPYKKKNDLQMKGYGWHDGRAYKTETTKIAKVFFIRDPENPRIEKVEFTITVKDRIEFERRAVEVWNKVRVGRYEANTKSFLCNAKWCPHHLPCQGE